MINKNKLEAAFKMIDIDGNGSITVNELKNTFGKKFEEEYWENIIKEVDLNNDGEVKLFLKLSYEEFF